MGLKIKVVFMCVTLLFFSISCTAQAEEENIALHKSYTFSEKPNYTLTKGNDELDLTDGKKKIGQRFWQDNSTVGWSNKKEIQIDLDLGSVFSIDGFLINTARNSGAEVEFPMSCLVFTSVDNNQFEYRGDLMLSVENNPGSYQVKSFQLQEGNSLGRYIKFVVATKSKFVFLDEIEVYGKEINNKTIASLGSKLANKAVKKENMASFIEGALRQSAEIRGEYMKFQSTKDFLGEMGVEGDLLEIAGKSIEDLRRMNSEVMDTKLKIQSKELPQGVVFTPIKGNEGLRSFSLRDVLTAQKETNQTYTNTNEVAFKYFSLINNGSSVESINFQNVNKGEEIFEVLSVANLNNKNIKDALKPITNNQVSLKVGENKLFMVQVLSQNTRGNINVVASNTTIATIPLTSKGQTRNIGEKLHANVWAYLDKPILKDNKEFVVNDLENAGVDVIVVHSAFIDGYGTSNFSKLKDYLGQFPNLENKKVLLFYNLKANAAKKFNGQDFLDQSWKQNFTRWYKLMQGELLKIGVNTKEVYFYPYDEIKPNEVKNFVELIKWGKASIPDFKTFVTIIDEKTYEAGNHADVVQISLFHVKKAKQIKNKNIWVYDVLDHSRERNPYKDYRLMSWVAYYYDIKGVGFWNYSALPSVGDAKFNKTINGNVDYSVLYLDDDGNVLSSIRWKYFNQGMEDYKFLKSYENQVGKKQVREIVKEVIDNPNNSKLADIALRSLGKK